MALEAGIEPAIIRLTGDCCTTQLLQKTWWRNAESNCERQPCKGCLCPNTFPVNGALGENRTPDARFFKPPLYH